jgi:hypothetical protein
MIDKAPDYPQPPHRHLCLTGRRLHQGWLDALETHVPDAISDATKAYFYHLNGSGKNDDGCFECEPYRTGEK